MVTISPLEMAVMLKKYKKYLAINEVLILSKASCKSINKK